MKRIVLALLALLLLLAPNAMAHGDTGILELVASEPASETSVRFTVRLTYENDGETVSGTDVTVAVAGGGPQSMTSEGDGLYAATVDLPGAGEHPVVFRAVEPTAVLEHTQVVAATTTSTTSTTRVSAATATSLAGTATDPTDDGSSTWLLVVMGVIVVTMVVVAAAFARGRKR